MGAVAGLLAALAALATTELAVGVAGTRRSPVIAVGEAVVGGAPRPVEQLAIDVFGTNDKAALLVGIYTILALAAATIGVMAARRPRAGDTAIAGFGVVGVLAGLATGTGAVPIVASVVGAAVGIAVLRALLAAREAVLAARPGSDGVADAPAVDRRRFLVVGAGVAVFAAASIAVGRSLQTRASAAASRAAVVLPRARRPRPPITAAAEVGVDGVAPFVTPNHDFYRIDVNLLVPQVEAEGWTLRVTGLVDRPLSVTYDELLAEALVEEDITLACVSNEVGGDLIGNARWLGLPLTELLERAGIDPAADQVVGRSVDGFTTGFPVGALAGGRPALVAVGMNGEPLPVRHGFPARLVVAGLYGYVSATKWLEEIELTRFADFDQYWVRRGWADRGPIKTMARIDTPRGRDHLVAGVVPVAGVAWAPTRGVERVEVRVDDGDWEQAGLGAVPSLETWRQWVLPWDATPGAHRLTVRATDGRGETQTGERSSPFPDGATGWHTIEVGVDDV